MADKNETKTETKPPRMNVTFNRHDICRILKSHVEDLELFLDDEDAKKIEVSLKNEDFEDLEGDIFAYIELTVLTA